LKVIVVTEGKSTGFIRGVLFELQIKYKCARVVRVCVHVPSSPSAAVTEKKKAWPAVAGIIEKWTWHSSKLFPVCFCSPSPHYTSVSPFDYYNDQRAWCDCQIRDEVCNITPVWRNELVRAKKKITLLCLLARTMCFRYLVI